MVLTDVETVKNRKEKLTKREQERRTEKNTIIACGWAGAVMQKSKDRDKKKHKKRKN